MRPLKNVLPSPTHQKICVSRLGVPCGHNKCFGHYGLKLLLPVGKLIKIGKTSIIHTAQRNTHKMGHCAWAHFCIGRKCGWVWTRRLGEGNEREWERSSWSVCSLGWFLSFTNPSGGSQIPMCCLWWCCCCCCWFLSCAKVGGRAISERIIQIKIKARPERCYKFGTAGENNFVHKLFA